MKQILIGLCIIMIALISIWMLKEDGPKKNQTPLERGRYLVEGGSCRSCHQMGSGFRAPRLEGLLGKERLLSDGSKVIANREYMMESLIDPKAKLVEGYQPTMPSFESAYNAQDLEAIVVYLEQLKEP